MNQRQLHKRRLDERAQSQENKSKLWAKPPIKKIDSNRIFMLGNLNHREISERNNSQDKSDQNIAKEEQSLSEGGGVIVTRSRPANLNNNRQSTIYLSRDNLMSSNTEGS